MASPVRLRPTGLLALLVLAAPAAADTLKVPADFATIGEAVAAAQDGDTIIVSKGTYLESVTVTVPNLQLVGKKAVIDSQFDGTCLEVEADGVSVSGFTLVNGTFGVLASGSDISISKCQVRTCAEAGISAEGGPISISGNTVEGCGGDGISYLHSLPGGESLIEKNVCVRNADNGIRMVGDDTTLSKNECEQNGGAGIDISAESLSTLGPPASQAVLLVKNTCRGNEASGAVVSAGTPALVTIEKNDFSGNGDAGLSADAVNVTVSKNTCDGNGGFGMDLSVTSSQLEKNSASANNGSGIRIGSAFGLSDGGFGTGNDNQVAGNTCKDNRGDGLVIASGNDNTLDGNKCTGNLDDGIDVDTQSIGGTSLLGNTCSDNGHEGIDNQGQDTVITDNVCKNNGQGTGPDIAGTGDSGLGTTAAFDGNVFKTGGESSPSRLDNYIGTGL